MFRKSVRIFLLLAVFMGSMLPPAAVARENLQPVSVSSADSKPKTTVQWIAEDSKKRTPENFNESEIPRFSREDIANMDWDPLPVDNIQHLYAAADRKTLQIAAYFYSNLEGFLSRQEVKSIYEWTDKEVLQQIAELSPEQFKLLSTYTPAIATIYNESKQSQTAKSLRVPTQEVSAQSEEVQYKQKDQKWNYELENELDPVDDLYKTANIVEVDLVLEGKHGLDFVLERRYNSLNSQVLFPGYGEDVNRPYSDVAPDDDVRFAAGWEFNIPSFTYTTYDITTKLESFGSYERYSREGERYNEWMKFFVKLDDGSTYTRGDGWRNYAYEGIGFQGSQTSAKLTKNGITYEYNYKVYEGTTIRKTNPQGARITYFIPSSTSADIEITDSVGRLILLKKNGPYSSISDVEVYADSSRQQLLKRIHYELNTYTGSAGRSFEYIQLESVTEISPSNEEKVVSRYQYHDPSVKGRAEFNYESNYELPKTNGIVEINGIESQTYIDRDNEKRKEICYLLLSQVEYPVNGIKLNYRYSTYDKTGDMLERGVVRLYQDDYAITYVSYHPVTSVVYSYLPMSPNPINAAVTETFYSTNYVMMSPEIWKAPKSSITRLANVSERNGDIVLSKSQPNGRPGYEIEQRYILNPLRMHVLSLVKQTGEASATAIADGNKQYKAIPVTYSSYKYTGNQTDPTYVYTFADPQGAAVNQQVYDYLLHASTQRPSDTEIKKYANYVYREYNKYGDITLEKDTRGNQKTWVYYLYNNEIAPNLRLLTNEATQAYNDSSHSRTATYTYNSDYQLSSETIVDSYPGKPYTDKTVRTYTYQDKLLSQIREEIYGAEQKTNVETITSYDQYGVHPTTLVLSTRLAPGQVETPLTITYQYDNLGQLIKQGYPDGSHAEYAYDVLGRLTKDRFVAKDGSIRETRYAYDDPNRKVTQHLPDGTHLVTRYTPFGDVEYQAQIGTNGQERPLLFNRYTKDGKLLDASYPFALPERKISYTYNGDGTLHSQTDSIGTTYYGYANVSVGGTSYLLESASVVKQPNGLEQYTFTDRYGNTAKIVSKTGDGTQEIASTFGYDGFDNPIEKKELSQSGESRTWKYQYDLRGQLVYILDPESNEYHYEYDTLGNLVQVRENHTLTTRYRYNSLSWKLQEEYLPSGEKESFLYEVNGNVKQYTDKEGNRHEYAYTPFYELTSVISKNSLGNEVNRETREYVPHTSLVSKQTNSNGPGTSNLMEQRYTYDSFQRLASQQVFGRTYQFLFTDHDEQVDKLVYPDGMTVSYSYDDAGRLTAVDSTLSGRVTMGYKTEISGETHTVTYPNGMESEKKVNSFGQVHRLNHRKAGQAVWNETNEYDFGNVISITRNGTTVSYDYDRIDRLLAEVKPNATNQYAYDDRGNRLRYDGLLPEDGSNISYTFDERNRLRQVRKESANQQVDFAYHADGLRASKKENGEETKYVYFNGVVIEELDASNNVKARNIWGNQLLYRKDYATNQEGYYGFNGHGDVVSIWDDAGNLLNEYAYDSWGNLTKQVEKMDNPFLYSGEPYDELTGLYYLRARYYDPSVGRFISEDAYKGQVDNPLSLNRYTYVKNNPLRYIDPTGHWDQKIGANWVIKEAKNRWALAQTVGEKRYWENYANDIRAKMTKAGYSQSDIMQPSDAMIPDEQVMKMARESAPGLTFIADFSKAIWDYPGEAAAVKGAFFIGSLFNKGKRFDNLSEGLNFASTAAKHMDEAGRFIPVEIQRSVIKYGKGLPDPRGSNATMYYDVMYKDGKKYNVEVLYDAETNTVYHFKYTDREIRNGDFVLPATK